MSELSNDDINNLNIVLDKVNSIVKDKSYKKETRTYFRRIFRSLERCVDMVKNLRWLIETNDNKDEKE